MIEIGGMPILWHILKIYSFYGIREFIICCGYKGYVIKEYFANYSLHMADGTFNMISNEVQIHKKNVEPWRVTLVDTGLETKTGGRLKRVASYLERSEPFCFTYGDGLADVDIRRSIDFHEAHGGIATMTAVQPPGRFGSVEIRGDTVTKFVEKPVGDGGWINGGFFVLDKAVIDRIEGDDSVWEEQPLFSLAQCGLLRAFHHNGFWQAMDTMRDKQVLERHWDSGNAPWKVW